LISGLNETGFTLEPEVGGKEEEELRGEERQKGLVLGLVLGLMLVLGLRTNHKNDDNYKP
jgi:hypothetical protein